MPNELWHYLILWETFCKYSLSEISKFKLKDLSEVPVMKCNVTTAIWTQVQKVFIFLKMRYTTVRDMWYGSNVSHSVYETWLLYLKSSPGLCSESPKFTNSNWTELICNELLMTHYWLAMQRPGRGPGVPVPGVACVTSQWSAHLGQILGDPGSHQLW